MGKTVAFNPQSDAPILIQMDEKHLAALFIMIEDIVRKVVAEQMNLVTERPMDADAVAKFLDVTVQTVRVKTRQGLLPSHTLDSGSASPHRFYYASEINEKIKGKR